MKFYTNVAVQYNNVLVRGVHNGQRFLRKDTLSPKLFEPTNDKNATFHNLFGTPLQMVEFEDIAAARKYIASRKDVTGSDIHGNVNWQYQYITENYSGSIAFDPSLITVFAIDIETTTEHGFPNIDSPTEQVSLITICDINQKKTTTYGLFGDYSSDRENFTYKSFKTEAELFQAFLDDWNKNPPDVITG